jgi:hypothetical protein
MDLKKSHFSIRLFILIAILTAPLMTGCGDDLGPTGTLSGRLTYNSEPLPPKHAIVFYDLTRGYIYKGDTDTEGNFVLFSDDHGEKVPIGEYSIMVRPPVSGGDIDPSDFTAEQLEENPSIADGEMGEVTYPMKYNAIATSGLTFTVKEGENTFDLDMKD